MNTAEFLMNFGRLSEEINNNNVSKGFWDEPEAYQKLLLIHCELSEAVEAMRKGNPPDDKLPGFSSVAVELADVAIRLMDYAYYYAIPLGEAILAKHKYNTTREYKHGKKF